MYWFSILSTAPAMYFLSDTWADAGIIFLSELALYYEAQNARTLAEGDEGT